MSIEERIARIEERLARLEQKVDDLIFLLNKRNGWFKMFVAFVASMLSAIIGLIAVVMR